MEGYAGQQLLDLPAFAYMYNNDDFTTLPTLHMRPDALVHTWFVEESAW